MSTDNPSRRILSRSKPIEDEHHINRLNIKTEIKSITRSTAPTKIENQENDTSIAASYINKEPFNEDIVIEESTLIQDMKWRVSVIDKFKEKTNEIKKIHSNSKASKTMLSVAYRQGLLLCASIKKLNRVANMRVNKARNMTHEEKNKIDEHHLELQNFMYEISHLQVEINKCLEFRSVDEDIHLVDLDTFYANAPAEIAQPDITKLPENVHKLKLARLDWELTERQNMTGRIKELENQIEKREQELKNKQNKLESLNPKLSQILEACKPTLDYFETNFYENSAFSEQVQYLPKPLYQFYMMMSSYRDTIDKEVEIDVIGDVEEAKRFDLSDTITFEDEDSDSNDEENENDYKKKKSKSKSSKKKVSNREKLFKTFPLRCKLKIIVKSYGELCLEFFYLNYLKIVAVRIETTFENTMTESAMLNTENLFNYLYPGDNGLESPNYSNKFLFNNMGIKSMEPFMKNIGIPYKWCQILCSLYYGNKSEKKKLSTENSVQSDKLEGEKLNGQTTDAMDQDDVEIENKESEDDYDEDESNEDIEELDLINLKNKNEARFIVHILNRLKSRFKARVVLQKTINSTKNMSLNSSHLQRLRIQSTLVSCKESSYEKFSSYDYTQHLSESNLQINETDCLFYEIILLNSAAKLQAQVVINQDYPKVAPLFAINVNWKHERNFTNDEAIRELERELNVFRDNFLQDVQGTQKLRRSLSKVSLEDKNYDLFAKQINHLLVCFDVYLESESYYLQDNEYQRTKLFPKSVRGRDRRRPYSYLANKDLFVQRMQLNEKINPEK